MLRRNFLKTAGLTVSGVFIVGRIPIHANIPDNKHIKTDRKRHLHFQGHARSGCATRPEIAAMFENGIYNLPG